VMVAATTEFWRTVGDDAHSPVSLVIQAGELRDCQIRFVLIEQLKPHGHGSQDARLIHGMILFVESERESFFLRDPERLIHQSLLVFKINRQLLAHVFFSSEMREVRKRAKRLYPQRSLVQLRFHGKKRAAFHPAVADTNVFWESMLVVSRTQKFVGFPKAFPFFLGKCRVAALRNIVIHRDEVHWSCIRGSVRVGIILKPVYEVSSLRNLVGNLAVVPLKLADEIERRARIGEISRR